MKVVFLNATGQLGGAERVLICLLKALRTVEPSWKLQVITGEDGPLVDLLRGLNFEVTVLAMPSALTTAGEASSKSPLALLMGAAGAYRYSRKLRKNLPRYVTSGY